MEEAEDESNTEDIPLALLVGPDNFINARLHRSQTAMSKTGNAKYGQGIEIPPGTKLLLPLWDGATNDVCEVCGFGGDLICCSFCNLCYLPDCLDPPLLKIPEGDWACPQCSFDWRSRERTRNVKAALEKQNEKLRQRLQRLQAQNAAKSQETSPPQKRLKKSQLPQKKMKKTRPAQKQLKQSKPPQKQLKQNKPPQKKLKQTKPSQKKLKQTRPPQKQLKQSKPSQKQLKQSRPPQKQLKQTDESQKQLKSTKSTLLPRRESNSTQQQTTTPTHPMSGRPPSPTQEAMQPAKRPRSEEPQVGRENPWGGARPRQHAPWGDDFAPAGKRPWGSGRPARDRQMSNPWGGARPRADRGPHADRSPRPRADNPWAQMPERPRYRRRDMARDPRDMARDPRDMANRDPRDMANRDPRGMANRDPRDIARDPRDIARDPREMARDPRDMARDPRDMANRDPREMANLDPREMANRDPRGMGNRGPREMANPDPKPKPKEVVTSDMAIRNLMGMANGSPRETARDPMGMANAPPRDMANRDPMGMTNAPPRDMARDPRDVARDPREMASHDPRGMARDPREIDRPPRPMPHPGDDWRAGPYANPNPNPYGRPPPQYGGPNPPPQYGPGRGFNGPPAQEEETGATACCRIFVGGLHRDCTDDTLRAHFEKFGEIYDACVKRHHQTRRSKGFGFVIFKKPESVKTCFLEDHVLNGRTVDVKPAWENKNKKKPSARRKLLKNRTDRGKVFVGGLPQTVRDDALHAHFARFGEIKQAVVMMDRATGRSRGFGFVTFSNQKSVRAATSERHEIDGKFVEVKAAQSRADPRKGPPRGGGGPGGYGGGGGGGYGRPPNARPMERSPREPPPATRGGGWASADPRQQTPWSKEEDAAPQDATKSMLEDFLRKAKQVSDTL